MVDATQPRHLASEPPDFAITGEARSSDGVLHANVRLRSEQAGEILRSHSFERPTGETDALREQIAAKVVDVAVCALGGHDPTLEELGVETMRLYLGGCDRKHDDWVLSAELLRQVTERYPGFAHAWAMFAAATAVSANLVPDGMAGPMRREALTDAAHALALDPKDGEAYFAQAEAQPGLHEWQRRQTLLTAGLAAEPSNDVVLSAMARALSMVGRWREAIAQTRRAIDADPFSAGKAAQLGCLLGDGGEVFLAHDALDAAGKRYPFHESLLEASFLVDAYKGEAGRAAKMLDAASPVFAMRAGATPWKVFLTARIDHTPAHVDAAMHSIDTLKAANGQRPYDLIVKRVVLGRVDEAYAHALTLTPEQADDDGIEALFWRRQRRCVPPAFHEPGRPLRARRDLAADGSLAGLLPGPVGDLRLPCRGEARSRVVRSPLRRRHSRRALVPFSGPASPSPLVHAAVAAQRPRRSARASHRRREPAAVGSRRT